MPRIDDLVNKLANYSVYSTFDLHCAYHQIPIREDDRHYTAFEADGKLWEFTRVPFGVTNGVPRFQRAMNKMVVENKLDDTFPYLDNITVAGRDKEEHDRNVEKFLTAIKRKNMMLNESKTVSSVTELNILGYCVGNGIIKPDAERLRPLQELPPPNNRRSLKRILGLFAYYAKWVQRFSDKVKHLRQIKNFPLDEASLNEFYSLK